MEEGQDGIDQYLNECSRLAKKRNNGQDISADLVQIAEWIDRELPEGRHGDLSAVFDLLQSWNDREEGVERTESSLGNARSSPCPNVQIVPQVMHVAPCNRIHIPDIAYLAVFFVLMSFLYLMLPSHRQVFT